MLKFNRLSQLKRAARWVQALFVLSVLNMAIQMPVHAAMQQAMKMTQQHNAVSVEPVKPSHCEMQASQQPLVASADMSNDDNCNCPPALCNAVEAQQDQLFQQAAALQLFVSLTFYPASFESQTDIAQSHGVVSLRYHDLHYRQISPLPLSLNTVLLI